MGSARAKDLVGIKEESRHGDFDGDGSEVRRNRSKARMGWPDLGEMQAREVVKPRGGGSGMPDLSGQSPGIGREE